MELKENVRIVSRPDKIFVYSADEGNLFETNEIGEAIIKKILEGASEQEIVEYLCKETGEDKNVIERDTFNFIQQLKDREFLK